MFINAITTNDSSIKNLIKDIRDKSDYSIPIQRRLIRFKNGCELSVISGFGTYGGEQGLFEIRPVNINEETEERIDCENEDVRGYIDLDELQEIIGIIGRQ